MKYDNKDLQALKARGKSESRVEEELRMLHDGFPYLEIAAPATLERGIAKLNPEEENAAEEAWLNYLSEEGHKVMKMVPASGAASRMFKMLQAFANGDEEEPSSEKLLNFFNNIERFAFFRRLNFMCLSILHKNVAELKAEKRYKDIINVLLRPNGMNYGSMPKAMVIFHKIIGSTRTALEEHLAEAAQYASTKDGMVNIHFTVSPEHMAIMQSKVHEVKEIEERRYGVKFNVTYSVQKPSTDTIAANLDGTPFRDEKGDLLFRPGGHGALIENLNDLDADIVFIKNIDNVVPDSKRYVTNHFKSVIAGVLVQAKRKIDKYLKILEETTPPEEMLNEMYAFMHNTLCITHDGAENLSSKHKAAYLYGKFNRPLRVCGMVKNEGEPGGGPFMVYDSNDETVAPQILELVQIDTKDPHMQKILAKSSHFNPVDLVCSIKNHKGEKFDLTQYVDKNTGFISQKSSNGVDLKALELPGLWNGAMSEWNTIFVEVPAETFNPVKEVVDLLRPTHQFN
jgi:hypothetical protein